MEENEYRETYNEINAQRCVFEKAINSRVCGCAKSHRFNLADREGVACQSSQARMQCEKFIAHLRENARFALHLTRVPGPLPHASEIKVQNGGVLGLQKILNEEVAPHDQAADVHALIAHAVDEFSSLDKLPYDRIVQSIVNYEMRRKRRRSN